MRLCLIAAVSTNGVIGAKGDLPWHLPEDLKEFKRLTMGHHLILGRKTFDSIGRPLPGREMLVITRGDLGRFRDLETVTGVDSLDAAIETAGRAGADQAFVAGGAQIYALALARADRLHLTRVEAEVDGDVFFPEMDWTRWRLVSSIGHPADERHAHSFRFEIYDRSH